MSALNSTQAIVDDRDRRIVYNDPKNWFKGGVSQEYNTTETGTFTKGSTARFSFNGSSVAVYGTVPANTDANGLATVTFTLDRNPPVLFTATTARSPQFQQQYYQSGKINDGSHIVIITYTDSKPATFWIDYILYTPSSGTSPSSVSSHGSNTKGHTNVGAIAGGVVGGVVLVVAALLFYFLYYRRRRQSGGVYEYGNVSRREAIEPEMSDSHQMGHQPTVVPFHTIPSHGQSSSAGDPRPSVYANNSNYGDSRMGSDPTYNASQAHQPSQPPDTRTSYMTATNPDAPSNYTSQPYQKGGRPLPSSELPPQLHEDGGVRLGGGPTLADPETPHDVPPVYKEY